MEPNSTFSFLIWSLKRIQRCSELQLSFVLIGVQRCGSSLFFQPGGIKPLQTNFSIIIIGIQHGGWKVKLLFLLEQKLDNNQGFEKCTHTSWTSGSRRSPPVLWKWPIAFVCALPAFPACVTSALSYITIVFGGVAKSLLINHTTVLKSKSDWFKVPVGGVPWSSADDCQA